MIFFRRLLLIPLFLVLVFTACRKGTSANWDVDAVAPVLNCVLNIKNFAPDSIFQSDNTGLLHLRINREVASLKLDSLVSFPDTTIKAAFKSPVFFDNVLQPGAPITPTVSDIKFDFADGVALTVAEVREGKLKVKFSNDLTEPLDIIYKLPTVTKNGVPFSITETIPPGKFSLEKSYDVSGFKFGLRGTSGNEYNTLAQTCSLNVSPTANSVTVKYQQGAEVEINYENVVAQFIEGYFGQQEVDIKDDTTNIALLDKFSASNFLLKDVRMDFTLVNEFGVDFSGYIKDVTAHNSNDGRKVVLSSPQLNSINIDRATRVGTTVTSKSKLFSFTTTNSNIAPFISVLPNMLTYSAWFKMNPVPPGNVSGYKDFAFYNTGIRILADIDIPLKFTADHFRLSTISDFEFSKNKALEGVNSGQFNVYASNGFPCTAQVQAYMLDAGGAVIDSVFVPGKNLIPHGSLNANNEVTEPVKSTMVIPVTKAKIDNLARCKKLKIVSFLLMPPNPPDITIFEKYELAIKITAEVNYNIDLDR